MAVLEATREHSIDRPGALVISLDFELHWGMRDRKTVDEYRESLLGARTAVPAILDLFREFEVAATWATVGFLFAKSREEVLSFRPQSRPEYEDWALNPYDDQTGASEEDDPYHFATSLLEMIRETPRQEIGSHTFSHYYCLEKGSEPISFSADLRSAVEIARARGIQLKSLVFPRNQHDPAFDAIVASAGFSCFRGNARSWLFKPIRRSDESFSRRLMRMCDSYLPLTGSNTVSWDGFGDGTEKPVELPASRFLRPYEPLLAPLEPLRFRRIERSMTAAAKLRHVYHLWWHPHNFGRHQSENLKVLRRLLVRYAELRERYDMRSLAMGEVAEQVLEGGA